MVIKKYVWFLVFVGVSCFGQVDYNEYMNSGSISTTDFSFAIGEIFVVQEIALEEEETQKGITVISHPNPSNHTIYLFSSEVIVGKDILIYDALGRMVSEQRLNNSSLNIETLPNGVYFLKSTINEFNPIKIVKN